MVPRKISRIWREKSLTFQQTVSIQNKRTCLILDDDVDRKLRHYQAKLIQKNSSSCSYSQAINHVLRGYLEKSNG